MAARVPVGALRQVRAGSVRQITMNGFMVKLTFAMVALVTLGQSPATAVSLVYDVTPANIDKQSLQIGVNSESYSADTVVFRVSISSGRNDVSPLRTGRLELAATELEKREDALQPCPPAVFWCSVQEEAEEGTFKYSFGLPRDALPRASFTFRNGEPSGMPAFDGYRVLLKEFAPKN